MTKLNTQLLTFVATEIRSKNRVIHSAFDRPQREASTMDREWDGTAAYNAVAAFNKIKNNYPTARFNALENAARALETIANGYELTEEKNESIADRFK